MWKAVRAARPFVFTLEIVINKSLNFAKQKKVLNFSRKYMNCKKRMVRRTSKLWFVIMGIVKLIKSKMKYNFYFSFSVFPVLQVSNFLFILV